MKLTNGHTPVFCGVVQYNKGDDEKPERIEYTIMNMAREAEQKIASVMENNNILPHNLARINLVTGGNPGKGTLQ